MSLFENGQNYSSSNKFLSFLAVLVLVSFLCWLTFFGHTLQWDSVWQYRHLFIKGWLVTIFFSLMSLICSTLIGLIAALARRCGILVFRYLSFLYVEIIRGTPLLVQILFFFYVIANAVDISSRTFVGIITLSLFSGAYIAEMIRAGFDNIRESQLESAKAIGLSPFQTYRFVIFPQAFRQILPPLTGQFASIIKDSSLLSIIGINELTNSAQQINSATYSTLESFFPLAVGYLVLTLPISLLGKKMERKFSYEN